jgi:hypothetical protein
VNLKEKERTVEEGTKRNRVGQAEERKAPGVALEFGMVPRAALGFYSGGHRFSNRKVAVDWVVERAVMGEVVEKACFLNFGKEKTCLLNFGKKMCFLIWEKKNTCFGVRKSQMR